MVGHFDEDPLVLFVSQSYVPFNILSPPSILISRSCIFFTISSLTYISASAGDGVDVSNRDKKLPRRRSFFFMIGLAASIICSNSQGLVIPDARSSRSR